MLLEENVKVVAAIIFKNHMELQKTGVPSMDKSKDAQA